MLFVLLVVTVLTINHYDNHVVGNRQDHTIIVLRASAVTCLALYVCIDASLAHIPNFSYTTKVLAVLHGWTLCHSRHITLCACMDNNNLVSHNMH